MAVFVGYIEEACAVILVMGRELISGLRGDVNGIISIKAGLVVEVWIIKNNLEHSIIIPRGILAPTIGMTDTVPVFDRRAREWGSTSPM